MGVIWESLVSWAADPPDVLVYGPTLTAEMSVGPVVLRVLAVHTAEAVYLGVEARMHTLLEAVCQLVVQSPLLEELVLCTVPPPWMGLKVGAVVLPSKGLF